MSLFCKNIYFERPGAWCLIYQQKMPVFCQWISCCRVHWIHGLDHLEQNCLLQTEYPPPHPLAGAWHTLAEHWTLLSVPERKQPVKAWNLYDGMSQQLLPVIAWWEVDGYWYNVWYLWCFYEGKKLHVIVGFMAGGLPLWHLYILPEKKPYLNPQYTFGKETPALINSRYTPY